MRKLYLWSGALSLVVAAFGTFAMPAAAQTQPQQWSGLYIGANVGGVVNRDTGGNQCFHGGDREARGCAYEEGLGHMNMSGFLGGAQLGWNIQAGSLVFGPEVDYQGVIASSSMSFYGTLPEIDDPSGIGTFSASESMSSLQTERIRVGWATGNALVFVTGGWAQANVTVTSDYVYPSISYPGTSNLQRSGWVEGIGGEWLVAPRVSMKLQLLDYQLQPYSSAYGPSGGITTGYTAGKDFYFHGVTAQLGVNWRL